MSFAELGLIPPIAAAVAAEGYTTPTPIQARAIPFVLAGRDLLGLAQTGTGKTAAFALPILQRLTERSPARMAVPRPIRCLILTPTRELASQIGESFATYGRQLALRNFVIFGGVGMDAQKQALRAGMDILVATPGRLLDLMGQGLVDLKSLEVFVLDEADRMLDMGFIHDVRKVIVKLPRDRQTLFFSATMPREAQELADNLLKNPETVAVAPVSSTAERVDQEIYFVEKNDKRALLVDVLRETAMKRVLVFSRTKHGANRIAEHLEKAGVGAEAIHGNKSQGARERALANFKSGKIRVLVATDIAARGIDIDEVTHVVNFDVPEVPETYVHRIGRTARAGNSGMAMTFCDEEERPDLRAIERLTRLPIPVVDGHPYQSRIPAPSIFNERDPGRDPPRRPGNRGQRDASEGREHQRPGRRDMPRHGHDQRPRHDAARPAAPRTDGPRPAATGGGAPAVTGTPGGGPSGGRRRRRGGGGGGGYGGGSGGGGGGGGGGYGGGGGGGYGGR